MGTTVNGRAVRILLECILVIKSSITRVAAICKSRKKNKSYQNITVREQVNLISIWKPKHCSMKSQLAFMSVVICLISMNKVLASEKSHETSDDGKNSFNINGFVMYLDKVLASENYDITDNTGSGNTTVQYFFGNTSYRYYYTLH